MEKCHCHPLYVLITVVRVAGREIGLRACSQLVTTPTWLWSFLQLASLEERHQGQQSALVCKLQMEKEKHRTHASLVLGEREMHGKETDEWKYVGVCSVPLCVLMCCSF